MFIFLSQNPFPIFPQYVPPDTTNAVITTSLKKFCRKAEKVSLKVKNYKKWYKSEKSSALSSYCLGESSVDHHAENFLKVSETGNKFILFSKLSTFVFPHYVPMDAKIAVITTSPKIFWREAENVSLNVKNRRKTDISKKWSA